MKYLLPWCAVAGLAAISLSLPAHHARPPARATGPEAHGGRGRTNFARPAQFGADARRDLGAARKPLGAGAPVKKTEAAPRVAQSAPAAPAPKPAPKREGRHDSAGAAEGLMVGPDGVIYRREAEGR